MSRCVAVHTNTRATRMAITFSLHSHYTIVPFRYNFSLSHSLSLYIYTYTFGEKETKEKTAFRGQLSRINPHLCDCKFIECLGYYSYEIDWKMKQEDNGGEKKRNNNQTNWLARSAPFTPKHCLHALQHGKWFLFYLSISFLTITFLSRPYILSMYYPLSPPCPPHVTF